MTRPKLPTIDQARGFLCARGDSAALHLSDDKVFAHAREKYGALCGDAEIAGYERGARADAAPAPAPAARADAAPRVERVEREASGHFREDAKPGLTPRRAAFARYDAAFNDRSGSHIDPSVQPTVERADAEPGAYDPFAVFRKAFESSKGGARG